MSNYPIAFVQKEHHLSIQSSADRGQPWWKKQRFAGAPVLKENFGAILGRYGRHVFVFLLKKSGHRRVMEILSEIPRMNIETEADGSGFVGFPKSLVPVATRWVR
jgi:hypothetical protein